MASDIAIVRKVFQLPSWYIPSNSEVTRLASYLKSENSEDEARWARFLDCSAFCNEEDCFFCGEIESVFSKCKVKSPSARRE